MPLFDGNRFLSTGKGNLHKVTNLSPRAAYRIRTGVLTLLLGATLGIAVSSEVTAKTSDKTDSVSNVIVRRVTLTADGETRDVLTAAKTIEELFAEHRVVLGENDRCSVGLSARITDGMSVKVTRVRVELALEKTPIPFPTKRSYSEDLTVGTSVVKQEGKPGEKVSKYRNFYLDGQRTAHEFVDTTTTPPVPQIEVQGVRGMTLSSRHMLTGRRVVTMRASAYGPGGNGRWGMQTASGRRPGHGVVAVDPRFIPLGTKLYIEGYGYAVAGDTGGAIKGDRIDLGMESDGEASEYGRHVVRVIILD